MCKRLFVDKSVLLCEEEEQKRNKNKIDHRDALHNTRFRRSANDKRENKNQEKKTYRQSAMCKFTRPHTAVEE
jgi:hypothetical protein